MSTKKSTTPAKAKSTKNKKVGKKTFKTPDVTMKGVDVITAKNLQSANVKEYTLGEFILGLMKAKPELTNEELGALVKKAGRKNSESTIGWYAARVRQGHIKG